MPILISGMHRSGTSLFASWLEHCGLKIHDGRSFGAGPGNPKGHFEDSDFVEFHSKIISDLFPHSNGWKAKSDGFIAFNSSQKVIATDLIHKRQSKNILWGWKDPRSVLFLPAWYELMPDLQVIFLWRSCIEVIDSLLRRSRATNKNVYQVNVTEASILWEVYNQKLVDYFKSHPSQVLVFNIHNVINNDDLILGKINSYFKLNLDYKPIDDVLDPTLLNSNPGIFAQIVAGTRRSSITKLEKSLKEISTVL